MTFGIVHIADYFAYEIAKSFLECLFGCLYNLLVQGLSFLLECKL